MHALKPYFIHIFFAFTSVAFIICLLNFFRLFDTGNLGISIASGSILYFFIYNQYAKKIHHKRFNNVVIYALFISAVIIFSGALFTHIDQSDFMLCSLILFVFWLFYELWYCQYPKFKNQRLKLGMFFIPNNLLDINAKPFSFNNTSQKRHIFVFYNGNWNQFCRSQLEELNHYHDDIKKHNIDIFIISSQNARKFEQLKKRLIFDAHYLIDKNNAFAQECGLISHSCHPMLIKYMHYSTPVCIPAVIVTDTDNTIIYSYLSGSLRTRPVFTDLLDKVNQIKRNANTSIATKY